MPECLKEPGPQRRRQCDSCSSRWSSAEELHRAHMPKAEAFQASEGMEASRIQVNETLCHSPASGGQLAALVAVELLLAFLLRLAVVGPHGYIDLFELSATLTYLPFLL